MARKLRRQGKDNNRGEVPKTDSAGKPEFCEHPQARDEKQRQPSGGRAAPNDRGAADHIDAENGNVPDQSDERRQSTVDADSLSAEYLDQLQRLKAEFDNYRRRVAREKEEWFRLAKAEVMTGLLPVLDDLRRAREHTDGSEEPPDGPGLLLILKRFEDILAQFGLEEQDVRDGLEFDPDVHEAVLAEPSESISEGGIVRILEPGYFYDGRMLRPSKVSVSSGRPPE